MTKPLVQRLREETVWEAPAEELMREAADEIERLERLCSDLQQLVNGATRPAHEPRAFPFSAYEGGQLIAQAATKELLGNLLLDSDAEEQIGDDESRVEMVPLSEKSADVQEENPYAGGGPDTYISGTPQVELMQVATEGKTPKEIGQEILRRAREHK